MKIIVAGGRDFKPTFKHQEWLEKILIDLRCEEVVSGGARGADKFGEEVARNLGIKVKVFNANWKEVEGKPEKELGHNEFGSYWKIAGMVRNQEMIDYAKCLIVFPGGKGTEDIIRRAQRKQFKIIEYGNDLV